MIKAEKREKMEALFLYLCEVKESIVKSTHGESR